MLPKSCTMPHHPQGDACPRAQYRNHKGVARYSLIRALPLRRLLSKQAPAFGSSLLIAELFYKFHSIILETGAFLATWFVVDLVLSSAIQRFRRSRVTATILIPRKSGIPVLGDCVSGFTTRDIRIRRRISSCHRRSYTALWGVRLQAGRWADGRSAGRGASPPRPF